MSHKFLEPIKIGNQTVKNRVMFLAMAKNISNFDDSVSAKDIAYVESVAAGGVGLLVPGAMIVDPEWPSVLPLQPGIYDDRFIPGLRRLVLAAHKYDAKILFQLWHPGATNYSGIDPKTVDELTKDEIHAIQDKYLDDFKAAMDTDDKNVRDAALLPIMDKIAEEYPDLTEADLDLVSYKMQKFVVRRWLLDEGKRVDGRGINEIRPLAAEVGILPRVHGSGMFTRGQTQVLTTCTLGGTKDNQLMDDLTDEQTKRYIHHYNFPPYSVGEARAPRSPGRREIGHGALAERALLPVLPSLEEFPYTIRCVSEVLSSNGSTSQASICGSTLALMDAGVPIKAPVAGISCGLITEGDRWMTMLDIQGVEDFHGEMDFKVAGTKQGITAIQMDLKNDGLTMAIIKNALEITYDARVQILDQIMLPCISEPRAEVSQYAPKMITMHIDPERIREVIGKGGSVIQKIVADTGAKVDIDDDGTIHIASANAAACDAAKKCIDDIVFVPEVGKLYYGRVVRLMQFGAFVEIAPGKDGLVHISKLDRKRVEKVEDVVTVGDMIWVKFMEIDEKGRWNLSRKDALIEIEAQQAAAKAAEQQ